MDKLVYLCYPILILLFVWGAKWSPKKQFNDEFMSIKQVKCIQGFAAVLIMMHHIGQETAATWQEYPLIPGLGFFVDLGYLFVAIFTFSSGYGLYKSLISKPDYFKGYLRKRVLPLILSLYIVNALYVIARMALGQRFTPLQWVGIFTGIGMPNPYSWYVITMPIFYILFLVSFKFFKKDGLRIFSVFVGTQIYTYFCTRLDHNRLAFEGEWWYNSVQLFWIGLLFARYEARIISHLKKYYYIYLVLSIVLAISVFFASQTVTSVVSYYGEYGIGHGTTRSEVTLRRWICLVSQTLAAFFFVAAVFMLNLKLKLGNRALSFMGTITLEFYMIHGLVLEFFSYRFCDMLPSYRITNVFLLVIVVTVLSVPAAVLLNRVINKIVMASLGRVVKEG